MIPGTARGCGSAGWSYESTVAAPSKLELNEKDEGCCQGERRVTAS